MAFANPLPWWALVPAVLLAAATAWLAYRRFAAAPRIKFSLVALRFCTLIALLVFLMRPVARADNKNLHAVVVPVLVDVSRSMGIEDANGRRRIDRAQEIVASQLVPTLGSRFHVELLSFGDTLAAVKPEDLSATARRSDLSAALAAVRERYRGRPVAGIVLLSDGGDTSGVLERSLLREPLPPVFTIGIGSDTVGRDREVLGVTAAEAVLDDSRVDLAVSAVSHAHGVEPIQLRLLENGRPIEVRRVTPAADGAPVREVFQVTPAGSAPTVYTVEIPEAAGELVPENNSRSAIVLPPVRHRRILLVEGAPGFEHSFLKRAWSADTGLEIDSVVRKGRNEQGNDTFYIQAARSRSDALTAGYPARPEDLFEYDAIVLANVEASQLTAGELDATRAFVAQRGGGLLVLGARSFLKQGLADTAVEEALPLDLSGRGANVLPASATQGANRVGVTDAGASHPIMQLSGTEDESRKRWEGVPALASIAPLGGPRPGASVLAVTNGPGGTARALIAVQRYGEGRSMVFTGEAAWRWRMLLPAADHMYEIFWRQSIRWLAMGATDAVAVTAPAGGSPGDSLPIRIVARNHSFEPQPGAVVDVHVTSPDGRLEELRAAPADGEEEGPGRFSARFRPEQPGVYKVVAEARNGSALIGTATTSMLVGGSDLEMTDPRLNSQLLSRLSLQTGGKVVGDRDLDALAPALTEAVPAATLAVQRDLWHNAWSFAAIALLLAAEWVARRRWGLR